jgi:hypothetical protein
VIRSFRVRVRMIGRFSGPDGRSFLTGHGPFETAAGGLLRDRERPAA